MIKNIQDTLKYLKNVQFTNNDFKEVLSKVVWGDINKERVFIYADPPYLDTGNNYGIDWSISDTQDLFKILSDSECRFAISEFDHPDVIDISKQYKLYQYKICERINIKNVRTELLFTNYDIDKFKINKVKSLF